MIGYFMSSIRCTFLIQLIIHYLFIQVNPFRKLFLSTKTAPQPKPKCRNSHIAPNSRCVTGFILLLISSSFRAFSNSSIRLSSSSASSSPKCVYVLSVTPMSLCPIRYMQRFWVHAGLCHV